MAEYVLYILVGGAGAFIAFAILYGLYSAVDYIFGESRIVTGTIIEKDYVPSTSGSGVGVGGDGKVGVIFTSTYEKYVLLIEAEGNTVALETNGNYYASVKVGKKVRIEQIIGRWSQSIVGQRFAKNDL